MDSASHDLGPLGRTPLRLILTPRAARPEIRPEIPEPAAQEIGVRPSPAPVRTVSLNDLRRDTLVRSLLGVQRHAYVFVTFSEYSSNQMSINDELRDEERAGGFGDDDEGVFPPVPSRPAPIVIEPVAPVPVASIEVPVRVARPRFPYKMVVLGLPLLMMLGAAIALFSFRHDPASYRPHEVQMSPIGSDAPTTTAGKMPPPPVDVPPPAPAAPPVAAPAPATPAPQTTSRARTKTAHDFDAAASSAASENVAVAIPASHETGVYLQVLATPNAEEAQRRATALRQQSGLQVRVTETVRNDITMYRVRLGPFASEAYANSVKAENHIQSAWIVR